jgi:hypothetical protein
MLGPIVEVQTVDVVDKRSAGVFSARISEWSSSST